jgi:hypothetical protein
MSDEERGRDLYLIASALALGAEALAAIEWCSRWSARSRGRVVMTEISHDDSS